MMSKRRRRRWGLVGLAAIALSLGYGSLRLRPYLKLFTAEISTTTLANFAQGAPLTGALAAYNNIPRVNQLRPYLTAPLYNDAAAIPHLVDSPEGEVLLGRLGRLIQTRDRQNSSDILRQALIDAAAEQEFTLIRVLQRFPEGKLRINGHELWRIAWQVGQSRWRRRAAIARLDRQFRQELSPSIPRFSGVAELIQPGGSIIGWTLRLEDASRQRSIALDLYAPWPSPDEPAPTVLISHGLTANRRTFSYLARHLASHGFLVVTVEHPDTNGAAHSAFLAGEGESLLPPQTLLERPRDITFVLDALQDVDIQRWFALEPFDLEQVGVIGHSLGGNTALALAGAEFDRDQLSRICANSSDSLNPALIFAQCPLLSLPEQQTQQTLRDERITSVVAINPVMSHVFRPQSLQQLNVPLLMVGSDQDWVTPVAEEQIQPFETIGADRGGKGAATYLALLQGGEHWTAMGGYRCLIPGPRPRRRRPPTRAIARDYLCGLSTAFFKTTLDETPLQPYLTADYAAKLSQPQLPLILVESSPGHPILSKRRVSRQAQNWRQNWSKNWGKNWDKTQAMVHPHQGQRSPERSSNGSSSNGSSPNGSSSSSSSPNSNSPNSRQQVTVE